MKDKPYPKFITPDLVAAPYQALEAQPFKPVLNEWEPLGPVAGLGTDMYGSPEWIFRSNPDNTGILVQSIIEFPEFAKFVGAPSYTFVSIGFGLPDASTRIDTSKPWSVTIDFGDLYQPGAVATHTVSVFESSYVSIIGFFTGLIKEYFGKPTLTIQIDSFWTGDVSASVEGAFNASVDVSTSQLKYASIKNQERGTEEPNRVYRLFSGSEPGDWVFVPRGNSTCFKLSK